MRIYTVTINATTPTITNDLMTIIAPANKMVRVKRIRASGEATSSTVMRTVIQRSTGGTTPGGAITPDKANSSDSAASTVVDTTWAAQPTLSGIPHYNESWNAFGGGFDLTLDGREIYLVNSEQLSIRNTIGTGLMSMDVEIEEL
jgi:hypothetical protein